MACLRGFSNLQKRRVGGGCGVHGRFSIRKSRGGGESFLPCAESAVWPFVEAAAGGLTACSSSRMQSQTLTASTRSRESVERFRVGSWNTTTTAAAAATTTTTTNHTTIVGSWNMGQGRWAAVESPRLCGRIGSESTYPHSANTCPSTKTHRLPFTPTLESSPVPRREPGCR